MRYKESYIRGGAKNRGRRIARVNIGKEAFLSLLNGFGPGVGDLRLEARDMSLTGTVALKTHMLHTRVSADVETPGAIIISDLGKFLTFVKALPKESIVAIRALNEAPLRVLSGNVDLILPYSDYIHSNVRVSKALALKEDSERDNWKHWGGEPLTCYGKLHTSDLMQVQTLEKIAGKNHAIKTRFSVKDKTWNITAGEKGTANMTVSVEIEDCAGPPRSCKSSFGGWFPSVVGCLPSGVVELYTAHKFVLILRHTEKEHLLVILDQRGD